MTNDIKSLLNFLDSSPVNFLAIDTVRKMLDVAGFEHLDSKYDWTLTPGGKYYTTANNSALVAFQLPDTLSSSCAYRIIASHSDSPGFRIKPNAEMHAAGAVKLNTEVYGGPILYTWFDRPLSLAGRVILRGDNPFNPVTRLLHIQRPLLTIPHLAIHYNRSVNDGNPISRQRDMLPVSALINDQLGSDGIIKRLISQELNVAPDDILDFDLSLYDTTRACTLGINNEFITSGRLDDLSMVYSAITSLLQCNTPHTEAIRMIAVFDNEETGSGTKQGAASPLLKNLMLRINECLGGTTQSYLQSIAKSFLISADNAHGTHPNYIDRQDPTNHPLLGKGPVIKINANCKYMTDAESASVYASICQRAEVPYQYFVNHSDTPGGSTLGNILTSQINMRGVDMGAALWAMHSVRETCSIDDINYTIRSFKVFFEI